MQTFFKYNLQLEITGYFYMQIHTHYGNVFRVFLFSLSLNIMLFRGANVRTLPSVDYGIKVVTVSD